MGAACVPEHGVVLREKTVGFFHEFDEGFGEHGGVEGSRAAVSGEEGGGDELGEVVDAAVAEDAVEVFDGEMLEGG